MNITRADGRIEKLCEHGIGHTIYVPEEHKDDDYWWIHGCDGCCSGWTVLDYGEKK